MGIILAGLEITFVSANMLATQEQKELSDPRIVSWRHTHGLGISLSDNTKIIISQKK